MTDEKVVGWFFDTSPRINSQYANLDGEAYDLVRGVYIHTVSRKPDVVEAIRAHRAQADTLNAQLEETP